MTFQGVNDGLQRFPAASRMTHHHQELEEFKDSLNTF